jgi:23S rRNA (cytosine1962-C5)-methyltransferase
MPANATNYELVDFGDGRKLERFGEIIIDRPCPAAAAKRKAHAEAWAQAAARYEASRVGDGEWSPRSKRWVPPNWEFVHQGSVEFQFQLDALPSGQVGVFPEQRENWEWIARQIGKLTRLDRPVHVLNLFAYTGGSTMAASAAGAEVTHVDASSSAVERARQNVSASGLVARPIRWIVEDALKYARRELKRRKQFDGVILDPPTYGHGPGGEAWKIEKDLLPLLKVCGELTSERRAFVLVTCHTPGIGPGELSAYLAEGIFGSCSQPPDAGELVLTTPDGRRLPSGVFARWPTR